MNNKLKFTLDNIIYNCNAKDEDVIEMILPKRTPTSTEYKSKYSKEKSTILKPVVQIEIKVFLTVSKKVPKLYIHGETSKSKIIYANSLDVQPNSTNQLVFTTTDGGNTWLVKFATFYSKIPEPQTNVITSVNGEKGPDIVLDSTKIHIQNNTGPTILDKFNEVDTKIIELKNTIKSEVTGDIVTILPNLIEVQIKETKIIAEKI